MTVQRDSMDATPSSARGAGEGAVGVTANIDATPQSARRLSVLLE